MELENNKLENDTRKPINSFQLFYKDNTDKGKFVNKMTNTSSIDKKQHISNVVLVLKTVLLWQPLITKDK